MRVIIENSSKEQKIELPYKPAVKFKGITQNMQVYFISPVLSRHQNQKVISQKGNYRQLSLMNTV